MSRLHNFDLLPWDWLSNVVSSRKQQCRRRPVKFSLMPLVNSQGSSAVKAGEVQQLHLETPVPIFGAQKERRRSKKASSVPNLGKHREEDEGPENKGKEVLVSKSVIVEDDFVPKFPNLRPRKTLENKQAPEQYGSTSGSKVDPKVAAVGNKFSVSLSKKEIEKDFLLMTSRKPALRPKKRNRKVQKQITGLKPGSKLKRVCAEAYKVRQKPSKKVVSMKEVATLVLPDLLRQLSEGIKSE